MTENAELSNARISSVFSPARNLNDVMYSYLVEIPLGTVENQYDKGHVQCDMAVTKSPHDMLYSIEVSSQEYGIDNSRQYCNIGACGDIAYLTYRTNVNYRNKHKYVTYYDNLDTEYDQLSNDVI